MAQIENKIADQLIKDAAGVEMKYCPTCKTLKPTSEFYANRTTKDKLTTECKKCSIKRAQESRERRRNIKNHENPIPTMKEATVTIEPPVEVPKTNTDVIHTADGRVLVKKDSQNKPLEKYTPRELLVELKRRGYKWDRLYVEQSVDWNKI